MARKNRTPEENARREKIRELLQMANIGSMDDIQSLFEYSARDCAPQPLKLSIHSGGIEHPCRCR